MLDCQKGYISVYVPTYDLVKIIIPFSKLDFKLLQLDPYDDLNKNKNNWVVDFRPNNYNPPSFDVGEVHKYLETVIESLGIKIEFNLDKRIHAYVVCKDKYCAQNTINEVYEDVAILYATHLSTEYNVDELYRYSSNYIVEFESFKKIVKGVTTQRSVKGLLRVLSRGPRENKIFKVYRFNRLVYTITRKININDIRAPYAFDVKKHKIKNLPTPKKDLSCKHWENEDWEKSFPQLPG